MKITIITPCSRPENLLEINKSIDFEKIHEWIIVYDGNRINENLKKFSHPKIKEFIYKHERNDILWGHPQRNFALEQIKDDDTFIYFLDDDNIIHPDFYKIIPILEKNKIYTFKQLVVSQNKLNIGDVIAIGNIDTSQFLIYFPLCKGIKWCLEYAADFHFINDCVQKNPNSHIFIDEIYAYYNYLR